MFLSKRELRTPQSKYWSLFLFFRRVCFTFLNRISHKTWPSWAFFFSLNSFRALTFPRSKAFLRAPFSKLPKFYSKSIGPKTFVEEKQRVLLCVLHPSTYFIAEFTCSFVAGPMCFECPNAVSLSSTYWCYFQTVSGYSHSSHSLTYTSVGYAYKHYTFGKLNIYFEFYTYIHTYILSRSRVFL